MHRLSSWPRFRLGAAGPLGVVIVIVYIESMRWVGVSPPTPFLLLFIAFVLAAIFGGVGSALVSAGLVALFTVYSAITSFGPSTLTGGPFQVSLGIAMTFALALVLGRMRTRSEAVRELEERIRMRMDDLAAMTELSRRALEYADLDTLFGEAVALLAGALRAKYCTVLELLPDGDALLLRAGVPGSSATQRFRLAPSRRGATRCSGPSRSSSRTWEPRRASVPPPCSPTTVS